MDTVFFAAIVIYAVFCIVKWIKTRRRYKTTEYYQQTKNSYRDVQNDKGRLGEFRVYEELTKLDGYKKFLFNLYIPKDDAETTEADMLLLCGSGIYVFECKNYSGWIFGTETQKYWTQTLPVGKRRSQKEHFFNPILQNKGHIKWLRAFLANQTLPVYSYIVFSNHCTLKNITLTSGEHCVLNQRDLLKAIRQNRAEKGTLLLPDEIDAIFEKLYPLTQMDEEVKTVHIENIEQKKQEEALRKFSRESGQKFSPGMDPKSRICPRCGGKLVARTAKKGSYQGKNFWGCSNYPRCKYIQNFPDETASG